MAFNAIKFFEQNRIDFSTTQQATKDWVQAKNCPFCGDNKYHFGMHRTSGAVKCWKCGSHGLLDSIKKIMNCSHGTAKSIAGVYGDISTAIKSSHYKERTVNNTIKRCRLPEGTKAMLQIHKDYLAKRNYDPEFLEKKYGLKGVGVIPHNSFSNRIIIPVYHAGVLVSYQGRSIIDHRSIARYKNCRADLETYPHKKTLYAIKNCTKKSIVVTEGVSKVWRLGDNSTATFGIMWKKEQAEMLMKYDRIFIMFDKGEQAQLQADKLAYLLSASYLHTEVINLDDVDDPGELSDEDAKKYMKEICG